MKQNTLASITISLLTYFWTLPSAQAVLDPPPDGAYERGNTAEGENALFSLTTGSNNTAAGLGALHDNTTGSGNTATGAGALHDNNAGYHDTAVGYHALFTNTTGAGNYNTAVGAQALLSNIYASDNTAIGANALKSNTTCIDNTATGTFALYLSTTGSENTVSGNQAMHNNTTGANNTAVGSQALFHNTTGFDNIALGANAGFRATTGSNNIYIGGAMDGVAGEANHTYIGNINTTTVSGSGTDNVMVNLTTGLLGHLSSSRRYKEDIKPMDKASEAVFALKPVTYHYKKIDSSQSSAFGLIAEEVAQVNPDLVACNSKGQPESVHYEMVNAMLLNEFLKAHRKIQELEANNVQQQRNFTEQQKQIDALTASVQKVSAQLELSKSAPQTVLRNQ